MVYTSITPAALCPIILLGLSKHIYAQTLQGCAAVDCPNRYVDMLSPTCQVESTDMRLVGLLSTESQLAQTDLTWTIGDSGLQSTIQGDERTVTRSFYLGTPEKLDLTSSDLAFKGCAIFIISPETGAYQVYDQGASQYVNTASCVGSLGETCVGDLTARVEQLARLSSESNAYTFCRNIADALQETPPSSCYILSQKPRIEAVVLTGSSAPKTITLGENSTSNCWPTLPKTNDLTKVFEHDHVAQLNETVPWLGYTPLITVLAPFDNITESEVEVNLTCMKIVDSDDFSASTETNGTGTADREGDANSIRCDSSTFVAFLMAVWLVASI
ncbi:unnamed protein product [Aureobasidium uvarum]|uniref:Uncharacterized protein n=1 Tax=Aureobasidium uvarum TaxID=2773716 RepID=A0A9N8KHC4_9PEZI|nr:unnamed protein product [Aureobasidium uvarum]